MEADTDRGKKRDDDVIAEEKGFVEEWPLVQCWVILQECDCRKHKGKTERHTIWFIHTNKSLMKEAALAEGNSQVWSELNVCVIPLSAALILPV